MSRKPTANQHPQCCRSLKLIYRQNLDLISIFLNYSFLIHRNNSQIRAFEFPRTFYDAIYLPLECSFGREIITYLYKTFYMSTLPCNKISLLVITGAIIEK